MAIIQSGANSTVLQSVDPTFLAARQTNRPPEILGAYNLGMRSGALTVVAAGAPVYSFRWAPPTTTNLCMVRRVRVGFSTVTAFTALQALQYSMTVARAFNANDTGGTAALFTQTNTAKLRTVMPNSGFVGGGQIMISNAGALTAVTRTLDTETMGFVQGSATGLGTTLTAASIYDHQSGDYPLILANNEGFVISNLTTMGAAGVINLTVSVEWMELAATTGNPISF
jgi:hypothetical protein